MIGHDPDFATRSAAKQRRGRRVFLMLTITLLVIGVAGIIAMAGIAAVVVTIVNSFLGGLGDLIAASMFSLVIICMLTAICWLLVLLSAGSILETIGFIMWLISMYFVSR
jgi:hypothetical protein